MAVMSAGVVEAIGEIRVREVPQPELLDESLTIKVHACAICGSDVRIFTKGDPRATLPRIIGHEIAGEVVEVGARLDASYRVGDRVCVAPIHGCGQCKYCQSGKGNVCTNPQPSIGYASSGGFAQYIVPPESVVRAGGVNRIPAGLSYAEASMSELLACCINAQEKVAIQPGESVLILGAGPAGCMHIQLARCRAAGRIMVSQRSQYRLDMARRFGPDLVINSSEEDLRERVLAETDGNGADIVIVAAPSAQAQQQALELVAPGGRVNLFGGLPKDACHITINANVIHYIECYLSGASSSLGRQNAEALQLIADGQVSAKDYITHRYALDKIAEAFQAVVERKSVKAVVYPWGIED